MTNRTEAAARCEGEGGYLASIHSPEENKFVHQLSLCTKEDFWIGSHDKNSDRSWEWSDKTPWTYTNWARVEHTGDWWLQNCAHMFALGGELGGNEYTAGQWHIIECGLDYNFVCQQPASITPRAEPCNTTTTLCLPTKSPTTKTPTTKTPTTKTPTTKTSTRETPTTKTSTTKTDAIKTSTTSTTANTSATGPTTSTNPDECSFTYNRICALRVDYTAKRNGRGAILTYDQQMFTSDDLQTVNFVDGKYTAPETGEYAVNFWTKGFTSDGKVELYHNDRKIMWDKQTMYDQYHTVLFKKL